MSAHSAAPLFAGMTDSCIRSVLSEWMGDLICDDPAAPRSAIATVGCFSFLAGEVNEELLRHLLSRGGFRILVPKQDSPWARAIPTLLPHAEAVERYGLDPHSCFDRAHLIALTEHLPMGIALVPIDRALYARCRNEAFPRVFVENYPTWKDFEEKGRGVLAMTDDGIVAGCSSFSSCPEGIEIEIATHPDFRRMGLAMACGAWMIRSCLDEGRFPFWDAANPASRALAMKLGYAPTDSYTAYCIDQ